MSESVDRAGVVSGRARVRSVRFLGLLFVGLPAIVGMLPGCSYLQRREPLEEKVDRIAILPIRRAANADTQRVLPGAERTITAHIYGVMSASPGWNFVPDLTTGQVLSKVPREENVVRQARLLGQALKVDAVLCGTVSKFIEREGSEYGARAPASVNLELFLVSSASGEVLWENSFDQTQTALSENLLNLWQFWRGGPRWFTAEEFSRLGVERLLEDLAGHL